MSIRSKLTVIILALVSIPLVFVGLITFHNYQDRLEAARLLQLQDLARFKAERIEAYYEGLKNAMKMAQNFYIIKKFLPQLLEYGLDPRNPAAVADREWLDGQLRSIQRILELSDIMLVDTHGKIVYVSNPGHIALELSKSFADMQPALFNEGLKGLLISDQSLNLARGNRPEMYVVAPAFDFSNTLLGMIVFELDLGPVHRLLRDTTGLGATGEVLIGKRDGEEIVYMNPVRHDPSASFRKRVIIGGTAAIPVQNAVLGLTGAGRSVDYRGEKVIAAWRHINSLKWGLVAKMDCKEAYASITDLKRLVIFIIAVVFFLAAFIIFAFARSISRPIEALSRGAEIIGRGDLNHRIGTNLKDEIGALSRAFDTMAYNLQAITASRDELNKEVEERTHAQAALQHSEEGLKQVQEIAHLGSWELDLVKNSLTWSDEVYRIFGLQPQEFSATYEAFLDAIHPDDRAAVDAAYSNSIRDGRDSYETEHRVVRKNGETRFVHERCRHFRDNAGTIIKSVGMVHDITRRKQAEDAVRESEQRLRALYASMNEGLVNHEVLYENGAAVDYRILDVNPAFERITGLTHGASVGKKASDLYGTGRPPYMDVYARVADGGEPEHFETYFPPMDKHFAISVFSPERRRFATVFTDITERKQSEAALQQSESRLNRAQEVGHLGSWELDHLTKRLIWSDEAYRIFGLQPGEVGTTYEAFLNIVFPDDRAAVDAVYTGSLREDGDNYEIEHRIVRWTTGEVRTVFHRCEHFRDSTNTVIRSVGMVHDITGQARARKKIQELNQFLEKQMNELALANKELEAFSYSVSHDLRNPLNAIITNIEVLSMEAGPTLGTDGKQAMDHIRQSVDRMARVISDLMTLSNISRRALTSETVNMSEMALAFFHELRATDQGRTVHIDIQPGLTVTGDPGLLRIMMENLVRNAWKFTSTKSETRIEIGVMEQKGRHCYFIRDNGVGFDPKESDSLFKAYHRLHSQKEFKGSGIGLATVKRIVDRMGGLVWAESGKEKGATFYFYF